MNKIVVFVLCLALVSCENKEKKVTSDLLNFPSAENGEVNGSLPEIFFEEAEFNFGIVAVGERITHSYSFVNKGKADLQIAQVTPSCGCTTLKDWPKTPIAPGGTGAITVEFNSAGFSGSIEKTIQVATNGIPRDYYLKLKGEVSGQALDAAQPGVKMDRVK
ncbi:MAG: DUF1573 domain-containing protein [Bacteroidota bacterium]